MNNKIISSNNASKEKIIKIEFDRTTEKFKEFIKQAQTIFDDLGQEYTSHEFIKPNVILYLGSHDSELVDFCIKEYKEKYQGLPIIISGGIGRGTLALKKAIIKKDSKINFNQPNITEAEMIKEYFLTQGVLSDKMVLDTEASSTYQNINNAQEKINNKEVLIPKNDIPQILIFVTSAQVKRTIGVTKKFIKDTNWQIQTKLMSSGIRLEELDDEELFVFLEQAIGVPEEFSARFVNREGEKYRIKTELKRLKDHSEPKSGSNPTTPIVELPDYNSSFLGGSYGNNNYEYGEDKLDNVRKKNFRDVLSEAKINVPPQVLKEQLVWLANQSEGNIPKEAKAIIVFGSPEHEIVGKCIADVIRENNLSLPVYISGDGTKGDSSKQTEAERIKNEVEKHLGAERKVVFILDKEAQNTQQNAINISRLLEKNSLSPTDSFIYINFSVLSRHGQIALNNEGINNVFTKTPTISDSKILEVEGWIKYKLGSIGNVSGKPL